MGARIYVGLVAVALVAGVLTYWVAVPRPSIVRPILDPAAPAGATSTATASEPVLHISRVHRHHLPPPRVALVENVVSLAPAVSLHATPSAPPVPPPLPPLPPPQPQVGAAQAAIASDDLAEASDHRDDERASFESDQVRFVVRAHAPQVRACYEHALAQNASLRGRVELTFQVTAQGDKARATLTHVASDSTGSPTLGACLVARLGEWEFPRPVDGDYTVTYPFVVTPSL